MFFFSKLQVAFLIYRKVVNGGSILESVYIHFIACKHFAMYSTIFHYNADNTFELIPNLCYIAEFLMTQLTFRNAFLVLGAINSINILCGILFLPRSATTCSQTAKETVVTRHYPLKIRGNIYTDIGGLLLKRTIF